MVNLDELLAWLRSGATTLYVGCNAITSAGACRIADRLAASPGIVRGLWLKRNPLGPDGGRIAGVAVAAGLDTLDLVQTGLDPGGLGVLVDRILTAGGAGRLFVSGNPLGGAGAVQLARLVAGDGVEELYASAADLGDQGGAVLTGALRPGRLRRLSVASNGIGAAVLVRLVEAAATAGIEVLDLGRVPAARHLGSADNHLGDGAAARVAHTLSDAPHRLAHLDLRHTGVTSRGALHFLTGARQAVTPTRYALGAGVASRVKRDLNALAAELPDLRPHPAVAAIRSVHRTAPRP
ncbi:ribonuclease inhibitor [Streptosporangium sp. CA-135522]|uniref:ribonuclease inhibitor n=1 Tax=Streptosporangium sp. CA-135522 TaxID=3240072 RepID=UPI003D9094F0